MKVSSFHNTQGQVSRRMSPARSKSVQKSGQMTPLPLTPNDLEKLKNTNNERKLNIEKHDESGDDF